MGFSIAAIPTEQPITFESFDGEGVTLTHVFRGVSAREFADRVEEGKRATVTAKDDDAPEARSAAREANLAGYLRLWSALILRVDGYAEADDLRGDELRAFFAGQGPQFEALDAERRALARDTLMLHAKNACDLWIQVNTARFSFRLKTPAGPLGDSPR